MSLKVHGQKANFNRIINGSRIRKESNQFDLSGEIYRFENCYLPPIKMSNFEKLSQEKLQNVIQELKILKEKDPDIRVNFKEFLNSKGYSSFLENLDFNVIDFTTKIYDGGNGIGVTPFHPTKLLCNIDFSGITLKNCNFKYTNLKGSKFNNVQFINSDLSYSVLKNCVFEKVTFNKCILKDAICNSSHFINLVVANSDLEYATFHHAIFDRSFFQNSSLNSVSFFKAKVEKSKIEKCQIEDTLFFSCNESFGIKNVIEITKPIIGFIWNSETPGYTGTKQYLFLRNNGALIFKLDACGTVDDDKLSEEVEKKIQLAKKGPLSIPQMFFDKATFDSKDTEFNSLCTMVKEVSSFLDGVVLPGGEDVHPEFFGGQIDENTHPESSYYRDLLEFSLIHESRNRGIPFQGICKGLQIANIYFGGNNYSKVYDQKKVVQILTPKNGSYGSLAGIIKDKIKSFSNHSQACNKIGKDLEMIITKEVDSPNGKIIIPKAMEIKYSQAAMFILTQFHPELTTDMYSDKEKLKYPEFTSTSHENIKICEVIIDAARQYKRKKILNKNLQK